MDHMNATNKEEKFYHYNKNLKSFSRELRKNSTLSEKVLWNEVLKSRKLKGYQFHRQRPIGKYIADFFCKALGLIIELDGYTHFDKKESDKLRENRLIDLGYEIIRFDDIEVVNDLPQVVIALEKWVDNFEIEHPEVLDLRDRKIKIICYPSP